MLCINIVGGMSTHNIKVHLPSGVLLKYPQLGSSWGGVNDRGNIPKDAEFDIPTYAASGSKISTG